jgi:Tfp pilus assembly PilM family ATPase
VKAIGGEFLRTTRFDPLHDAASEQQLHGIVQALADGLVAADAEPIELRTAGRSYQIIATSRLLADSTQDLIRTLAASVRSAVGSGSVGEIIIGGGAGRVPGLEEALIHQTATPIRWLEPWATALGIARLWPEHFERPDDPGVSHHTWRRAGVGAGAAR